MIPDGQHIIQPQSGAADWSIVSTPTLFNMSFSVNPWKYQPQEQFPNGKLASRLCSLANTIYFQILYFNSGRSFA